jgi:hypothetical protein
MKMLYFGVGLFFLFAEFAFSQSIFTTVPAPSWYTTVPNLPRNANYRYSTGVGEGQSESEAGDNAVKNALRNQGSTYSDERLWERMIACRKSHFDISKNTYIVYVLLGVPKNYEGSHYINVKTPKECYEEIGYGNFTISVLFNGIYSNSYSNVSGGIEVGGITRDGKGMRITGEAVGGLSNWGGGLNFAKSVNLGGSFLYVIPGFSVGCWVSGYDRHDGNYYRYFSGLGFEFKKERITEYTSSFGGPFLKFQLGKKNRIEMFGRGLFGIYNRKSDDENLVAMNKNITRKFSFSLNGGLGLTFVR